MILLVDDDPLTRAAHGGMLEEHGHTVIHSPDGAHALLCLRCNRFDLLLLDHQMPGMTGGELLQHLQDEGLQLPTIMVSGVIGPREVQALLGNGASSSSPNRCREPC
jgi:two-component system phosphate regulon response regulator PhoB